MLPVKPWRRSFGPLPRHLAGRIPVAPAFIDDIRRAAIRFYIDEVAAIAEETDPDIARERAARLDETLNDAVEVARTGVLSPSAARLLKACDTIFSTAERKSAGEQTSGGDRRPLPEVAYSRATKGGHHEDLAASDFPLTPTPAGKLLQLRPGQDVPVFGDCVTWDSRREAHNAATD